VALIKIKETPTLKQLRVRLAIREKEYRNNPAPWKAVSLMLDKWVQDNFKTEGGKVGGWVAFKVGGRWIKQGQISRREGAQEGIGRKTKTRALDTSAKLLQDTGRLRASFFPFASRFNAGIMSNLPYAKAHNEGIPKKGLPARRMLPKRREVIKQAKEILQRMTYNTLKKK